MMCKVARLVCGCESAPQWPLTNTLEAVTECHIEVGGQAPDNSLTVCTHAARQDSHFCSVKELHRLPYQRAEELRPAAQAKLMNYTADKLSA